MNPIYRTILSLSVISPLLLFFLVGYASWIVDWMNGFMPADWGMNEMKSQEEAALIIFGLIAVYLLGRLYRFGLLKFALGRGSELIRLATVKRLGMTSLTDFLPYILLFIFAQNEVQGVFNWAVALFLLFVMAWTSSVISYSPLLELCGLRFYEATTAKGETIIVITSNKKLKLDATLDLVRISECCYLYR